MNKNKYPQFVTMGHKCALRLVNSGQSYWYFRDGGCWDVDFHRFANGDLVTVSDKGSLNGIKLTPITESKWRECNGTYAPDDFERYGFELPDTKHTTNPCVEILLPGLAQNDNKYLLIRRR